MVPIELSGKVALITGASQGLGACAARRLHEAGARVAVNYFADLEGVNQGLAEEVVASLDDGAVAVAADVRDPGAVQRMASAVLEKWGRLDIVVNNAGIILDRTVRKMSPDEWSAVIDTNLSGVFHVCKAAAEHLAEGGRIVNMSSISAFVGFFGQANYAAAKAGVAAMTKVLSKELAKRRITVNAVAPGVVLTPMGQSIPDEVRESMLKAIPLGRFGEPQEIADVVLFLCSDLASYVTGQTIHVNGGWIA